MNLAKWPPDALEEIERAERAERAAKAEIERLEKAWATQQNLLVAAREEKGQDEDRIAELRASRDNWTARAGQAGRELQTARERIEEACELLELAKDREENISPDQVIDVLAPLLAPPAPKEEE